MPTRYLEDFAPGQERDFGRRTVTAEEIIDYARDYDPQPFHLDADAAARTPFGGLIASGWQVGAFAMRMIIDGTLHETGPLASPGLDRLQWLKPVRPGDTLSLKGIITDVTASRSKPDRGVVTARYELVNQRGELVYVVEGKVMVGRRPPAGAKAGDAA